MPNHMMREVSDMMSNKNLMQNDMREAAALVQNMFRDRYVNKIQSAVETYQLQSQQNPTREVQLMQAMKAFMPEEQKQAVDSVIDLMHRMNTAMAIRNELAMPQPVQKASMAEAEKPNTFRGPSQEPAMAARPVNNTAVHADGVYEYDSSCLVSHQNSNNLMAGLMLMLAVSRTR